MTLKAKISDLSRSQLLLLNKNLRRSCSEIIGDSGVNFRSLVDQRVNNYYGMYCPENHRISIFRNNVNNVDKYVQIYIHEWTHSLQKGIKKNYAKMDYKYGYYNNPYEIEARENEKLFKSIIWKTVKSML